MPATDAMVQIGKHGEVFAMILYGFKSCAHFIVFTISCRKKATGPETEVITYTNETSGFVRLRRSRDAGIQTFERGQRHGDAQAPKHISPIERKIHCVHNK